MKKSRSPKRHIRWKRLKRNMVETRVSHRKNLISCIPSSFQQKSKYNGKTESTEQSNTHTHKQIFYQYHFESDKTNFPLMSIKWFNLFRYECVIEWVKSNCSVNLCAIRTYPSNVGVDRPFSLKCWIFTRCRHF